MLTGCPLSSCSHSRSLIRCFLIHLKQSNQFPHRNVHIFQTFENNRWLNLYLATESSKNNCHPVACPANFYISLPTERNSLCFRKPPHGCLIHPKHFWLCQTHVDLNKLRHLKHRIIQILCNVHERTKGPAIVGSGENFPSQ